MTEQTPADALAQLRHLYQNMVNGGVRDTAEAAHSVYMAAVKAMHTHHPATA